MKMPIAELADIALALHEQAQLLTKLSSQKQLNRDQLRTTAAILNTHSKRIFRSVEDIGGRCNAKASLLRDIADSLDVNDGLPDRNRKQREAEASPWTVVEYQALADSVRPQRKRS